MKVFKAFVGVLVLSGCDISSSEISQRSLGTSVSPLSDGTFRIEATWKNESPSPFCFLAADLVELIHADSNEFIFSNEGWRASSSPVYTLPFGTSDATTVLVNPREIYTSSGVVNSSEYSRFFEELGASGNDEKQLVRARMILVPVDCDEVQIGKSAGRTPSLDRLPQSYLTSPFYFSRTEH